MTATRAASALSNRSFTSRSNGPDMSAYSRAGGSRDAHAERAAGERRGSDPLAEDHHLVGAAQAAGHQQRLQRQTALQIPRVDRGCAEAHEEVRLIEKADGRQAGGFSRQ